MASADADGSPGDAPSNGVASGDLIAVEIAYSASAGAVEREPLQLPAGSRVADALRHSAMAERLPALQAVLAGIAGQAVGVWGKRCRLDQPLRDGDRVEVCRPLRVDPKQARRERQLRQQGRTSAGAVPNSAEQRPGTAAGGQPAAPAATMGNPNR